MFGVILWSDPKNRRAVIWCEDHEELAFFRGDDAKDGCSTAPELSFEAGDLIRFDLRQEGQLRLACNLRMVEADGYPSLARDLVSASLQAAPPKSMQSGTKKTCKVIAFNPDRKTPRPSGKPVRRAV